MISWGLGDRKSSDVSRNSFSSVTIILHFWTEGYKNSNDDIFHCQEFFNNRRLQLQDNFHICTFVLTRGHLVYILKPGIHTLEPVGSVRCAKNSKTRKNIALARTYRCVDPCLKQRLKLSLYKIEILLEEMRKWYSFWKGWKICEFNQEIFNINCIPTNSRKQQRAW